MICKYKRMSGYEVSLLPGWDCHGLPIELKMLEELSLYTASLSDNPSQIIDSNHLQSTTTVPVEPESNNNNHNHHHIVDSPKNDDVVSPRNDVVSANPVELIKRC